MRRSSACHSPAPMLALLLFFAASTCALAQARTIHVFVALADNEHQGIVPVAKSLGNGDDPAHNLYWGAGYGVKTFFSRSSDWTLLSCAPNVKPAVLERCVYKHRNDGVYLIADAYQGSQIQQAVVDFLGAAAGAPPEKIAVKDGKQTLELYGSGGADLAAYVGHDGLMDFQLTSYPAGRDGKSRDAIILACASKAYFADALRAAGARPLLWTSGLMAPEAYTLKAAIDGWIRNETAEQIRTRAAAAYNQYQKCGLKAARNLFVTGW